MDNKCLLTPERIFEIRMEVTKGIANYGVTNVEMALVKEQFDEAQKQVIIPKNMTAWILKRLNGKDASEFMFGLSTGRLNE